VPTSKQEKKQEESWRTPTIMGKSYFKKFCIRCFIGGYLNE